MLSSTTVASIPSDITQGSSFHLVFERATEQDLYGFLLKQLPTLSVIDSWKLIAEVLCGVASGVDNLHSKGVLHKYVPDTLYLQW